MSSHKIAEIDTTLLVTTFTHLFCSRENLENQRYQFSCVAQIEYVNDVSRSSRISQKYPLKNKGILLLLTTLSNLSLMKINENDQAISIDVVLVSDAKNEKLRQITEVAIRSAGKYVNIIVVESNREVHYDNVTTVHPTKPFNYNAYLNLGAKAGSAEYILFGNNDLIFMADWAENIISEMRRHDAVSASPLSPISNGEDTFCIRSETTSGYEMSTKFCGWAFVWKREFFNRVQGLDEDFGFWCADNSAVEQLKRYDEKHILVTSSLVQHMGSSTLRYLDANLKYEYTILGVEKFNDKFQVDLWKEGYLRNAKDRYRPVKSTIKKLGAFLFS